LGSYLQSKETAATKAGIMGDGQDQCQVLLNRITVGIDMKLDMLSYLKGVKVPGRNIQDPEYNQIFDETARRIYGFITRRECPESGR
jgi:hypothetical protein